MLEDITKPKIYKFYFDLFDANQDNEMLCCTTSIVKRFLKADVHEDCSVDVYAEAIPSCKKGIISLKIVYNGSDVPEGYQYIDTFIEGYGCVYHLYAMYSLE